MNKSLKFSPLLGYIFLQVFILGLHARFQNLKQQTKKLCLIINKCYIIIVKIMYVLPVCTIAVIQIAAHNNASILKSVHIQWPHCAGSSRSLSL